MTFPFQCTIPVAWGDMDAFGHVNNVMYMRYFETARVLYFGQFQSMQMGENGEIKPVLASASIQYKYPVVFPDDLTVKIGIKALGNSSLTMACQMHSPKVGLAAEAECVIVMFDFKNQRPTRIPEALRLAIEQIENGGNK